jgi:phenylalanyl-tRNA synthetase beta chain
VLVANGFFEIFTDGFYGRGVREKLGLTPDSPIWDHIETVNAQDRTYAFLKNNCLAQAVEVVKQNLNFKTHAIKAFEWTRVFKPLRGSTETARMEQKKVWAIASGPVAASRWQTKPVDVDIFYCKGVVEQVSDALGLDVTFAAAGSHPLQDLLHPLRHLKILSRGAVIGILGEVHPQICQSHGIKGARPYYLEFDYEALVLPPQGQLLVVEPPELPPVQRSLAVSFPMGKTTQVVRDFIRQTAPLWLLDVRQVDEFVLEKDGQKFRSITFDFTFDQDGSRSAEDINQCLMSFAKSINETFADQGIAIR